MGVYYKIMLYRNDDWERPEYKRLAVKEIRKEIKKTGMATPENAIYFDRHIVLDCGKVCPCFKEVCDAYLRHCDYAEFWDDGDFKKNKVKIW